MIQQLIFISILLSFSITADSESTAEKYQRLEQLVSNQPQSALDELLSIKVDNYEPEEAAIHYNTLSKAYISLVYPQKALDAANQALAMLSNKQPIDLYYHILLIKTQAMEISGHALEALPMAEEVALWAEQKGDLRTQLDALLGLGYIQNALGNSVAALNAFMQAYNMAPETGITNTKGSIASSVALVYEYRREFNLATPFFLESVEYQRTAGNLLELSVALYGLGRANKHIGKIELGRSQLQESLDISRSIGDQQGVAYALKDLAPIYIRDKAYDQAEEMLNEAISLFSESQNHLMLLDSHKTMSTLQLQQNNIPAAKKHLELAKTHSNEQRNPIQAIALDEAETRLLAAQGDFQSAYQLLAKTGQKKQQLLSAQSTRQLYQLRTQFELESKEKANSMLAKENAEQKLQLLQEAQQNQKLMLTTIATTSLMLLLIAAAIYNRKQQHKLYQLANYDQLTGLPNRAHLMNLLKTIHQQLKTNQSIHLVMLDLDNFKQINDQLGHDVGDQVLKQVGELCQQLVSEPNLAGRFGGEEFLLVFIDCSVDEITQVIDTLRQQAADINHSIKTGNDLVCPPISFSAGLSSCENNKSINECIKIADLAMYEAKNTGRNRTVLNDFK